MGILNPDQSVVASLAAMTAVYGLYSYGLPSVADIRTAAPGNKDIESAERAAAWQAAAVVSGISLITRDPTIFIIGGATIVGLSWWVRHANMVDPQSSKAVPDFSNPDSAIDAQAQADATDYAGGDYVTTG